MEVMFRSFKERKNERDICFIVPSPFSLGKDFEEFLNMRCSDANDSGKLLRSRGLPMTQVSY